MKNLRLTQQIILLNVCILLLCCSLFTGLILLQGTRFAEAETFSRLETILSVSPPDSEDSFDTEDNNVMTLIYIQGNIHTPLYKVSQNYQEVLSTEECNALVQSIVEKALLVYEKGVISERSKIKTKDDCDIYFVYQVERNGFFTVVLTDSTLISLTMKKMTAQMFGIFAIIMLVACIAVCLWSQGVVKRIKKLQGHITTMPAENYKVSYEDNGDDEISDLSKSIENMRDQIGESEKTKQEMLQNISHDLKTPIAVIKSYAESILDGVSDPIDAQIILNQADALRNKVNKLLQYNRLEYLSKEKEFESVNMKEVVMEVVQTYKFQTPIPFILDLEDVYFKGYKENYYTVIDNIIDNAKRYAKSVIKIKVKEDFLVIYNDGEPIGEQFLNGVFKPYEKGSKGQFGLGMSIVKRTLDFFDVKLEVKNETVGVSFIMRKR